MSIENVVRQIPLNTPIKMTNLDIDFDQNMEKNIWAWKNLLFNIAVVRLKRGLRREAPQPSLIMK